MANNINFVQLSSYTSPVISENARSGWVEYGADNNYFQYLIDRYNGSPTNNAVVSGVIDMIFGKGIDATDSAQNPEAYLQLRKLIKDSELKKVINDYYLLGNGAFQVIYNRDKSKIVEVYHMPVECLRAEKCNDEGEVEAYYYAYKWSEVRSKKGVERIPAFGYGEASEKVEILYFRPYRSGSYYYSPVDYQGALPYAELEGEVANYHINNIKNGLAPSMIVNFNNGVPPEEERDIIESQIKQKWSGSSNSGKFILAFNDDSNSAASIEPVQLSDAHNQYEFLSRESQQKVLVGHRITSPMLFGVKDQTGLGNNADEIKTAFQLFDNSVIQPKQEQVIAALDQILAFNNIALNLYFETLTPIEFTDLQNAVSAEVVEEETGVKIEDQGDAVVDIKQDPEVAEELVQKEASYNGAQIAGAIDIIAKVSEGILTQDQAITFLIQMLQFSPEVANALFSGNSSQAITTMMSQKKHECSMDMPKEYDSMVDDLIALGEDVDEDMWELVDERDVDYDQEDALDSTLKFASTGTARPNANSEQDGENAEGTQFLVRYRYDGSKSPQREFCRKMMTANKVYRKEDIIQMDNQAVNAGFGVNGASTYSIWLYKGGARCKHKWVRRTYMSKGGVRPDVKSPNAETISTTRARQKGFRPEANDDKVAVTPSNMKNKGFVNPPSIKDIQGGI
jgi:hypothetical protein